MKSLWKASIVCYTTVLSVATQRRSAQLISVKQKENEIEPGSEKQTSK